LKNKTTLVTEFTSGIGREIAQLLAERGARVFGTVRNPQSASPIRGVEIVGMEVTNDASVSAAVQSIEQKAGPVQLWSTMPATPSWCAGRNQHRGEPGSSLKPISLACCA
jgi:NAD(P)-dependent dehydrogenase (short-subunit alcohol dehydrogenase family)